MRKLRTSLLKIKSQAHFSKVSFSKMFPNYVLMQYLSHFTFCTWLQTKTTDVHKMKKCRLFRVWQRKVESKSNQNFLYLHTCQILFNNNSSSFRQKQQEHKQWWKLQKAWDVPEEIWSQNQLGFSPRKIQSSLPSASYWRGWRRRGGVRWKRGWDFQGSRLQALSTLLDRRESWTRHWWTWSQEPEKKCGTNMSVRRNRLSLCANMYHAI